MLLAGQPPLNLIDPDVEIWRQMRSYSVKIPNFIGVCWAALS